MKSKEYSKVFSDVYLFRKIVDTLGAKDLCPLRLVSRRWATEINQLLSCRHSQIVYFVTEREREPSLIDQLITHRELSLKENDETCPKGSPIKFAHDRDNLPRLLTEFLQNELNCIPKCALFFTKDVFPKNYRTISPVDYPIVVLEGSTPEITLPTVTENDVLGRSSNIIMGCFINKMFTNFKVIVTDWTSARSLAKMPRPDSSSRPIKCILVFQDIYFGETANFDKYVSLISEKVPIGGGVVHNIIHQKRGKRFLAYEDDLKLLTLTFVGHKLEAAELIISANITDSVREELTNFKKSLNFNVDTLNSSQQTIGFIFGRANPRKDFLLYLKSMFQSVMFAGSASLSGLPEHILTIRRGVVKDSSQPEQRFLPNDVVHIILVHFCKDMVDLNL